MKHRLLFLLIFPLFIWSFSMKSETAVAHTQTSISKHPELFGDTLKMNDMIFADFFSPNGDGFNDTFVIINVENWPGNSLKVFNRWGEVVYLSSPYQNDWNGTNNQGGALINNQLTDGVYYFEFYNGMGAKSSGKVTIKR